jgi:hypothetical protein
MRNKTILHILILLFFISVLASWWLQPTTPVKSQIFPTFPIITLQPTATATRTPTPVSIGNFVWNDLDQDGIQDTGEPGYAGVLMQLWNSSRTLMLDQVTTGPSGLYQLTALGPGDYRIRAVLPSVNDSFSPKDQGSDDTKDSDIHPSGTYFGFTDVVTISSNVISTTLIDVGLIPYMVPTPTRTQTPINLGNFVWHDLNQNGIQDSGEPGVAGILVQLWDETKTYLIDQVTTGPSGLYQVVALTPGAYRMRFVPPMGSSFTLKDIGSDTADSDVNPSGSHLGFTDIINIASNVISMSSIDAGLKVVGATPTPTPPPPGAIRIFLPMINR